MPALAGEVLCAKLKAGFPPKTRFHTPADETHPALATVPGIGQVRTYLWTITHVESDDRPPDEYKIQLILPGQKRGTRGELKMGDVTHTSLLGYSPDFGVFVGWQAAFHAHFSFSTAVYAKESLLLEARAFGWAVASPRRVSGGDEVQVAFTPGNLRHFIVTSYAAERKQLAGVRREAFFLTRTPQFKLRPSEEPDESAVATLRERLTVSRLKRNSKFGPAVRKEYLDSCAVCSVQLNVVEGAHIIPANEENSADETWNGVALCRNHHRLFDGYAFIIRPSLEIRLDDDTIAFYRESGRECGVDTLLIPFAGSAIRKPAFYERNSLFRRKMREALRFREHVAAIRSASSLRKPLGRNDGTN